MKHRSFRTQTARTQLFIFALAAASLPLHAQNTRIWSTASYDAWEQGTPQGVAITSEGALLPAPVAHAVLTTPAADVWSAAVDAAGNAYLGTGSPALVLKVTPDGSFTKLLDTKDLGNAVSVQSVRLGPDGMLYAATLPHGKVYRIDPTAKPGAAQPTVVFDTEKLSAKPAYIWDLAFDAQGRLYIATGGPAAIYRIDPAHKDAAQPEAFFTSAEEHIRCLLFGQEGTLYAGSDGRGLVYRITSSAQDGAAKGFVLFESSRREVTALALDPAGNLYAASMGDKNTTPPLPPLGTHGGGATVAATVTVLAPGSMQASSNNTLLPKGTEIDQIAPDGAPHKLWHSAQDVVYALAWQSGAMPGLLAASGNQGHLYRIAADGGFADLAHLDAHQATALAQRPGALYVATSNTGKLYRLDATPAQAQSKKDAASTYTSKIFDAKFFSHWGRATVRGTGGYELFVRSGNVEQPEEGWSDWKPAQANARPVPAPAARFLQWKAVLHSDARMEQVALAYLPQNVAPSVDAIVIELHARVHPGLNPPQPETVPIQLPSANDPPAGMIFNADPNAGPLMALRDPDWATARWRAHDPNGDTLRYTVEARAEGDARWQVLAKNLHDPYRSFDLRLLPDGWYRLRITATDAPSNPAAVALTGSKESAAFLVDTTPPVLDALAAEMQNGAIHLHFSAKTTLARIARATVSIDAGPWQILDPTGLLSDAPAERYDVTLPLPAPDDPNAQPIPPQQHSVAVRVFDSAGNVAIGKAVVNAAAR
jgi:hypothetical protein